MILTVITRMMPRCFCILNISVSSLEIYIAVHTSEEEVFLIKFAVFTQVSAHLAIQVGSKASSAASLSSLHVFTECNTAIDIYAKEKMKLIKIFLKKTRLH